MSACLVTVNRITEILPIAKADKLELARVLDWYCIIQKDSYKVNDLIIYVPPDSILPASLIEKFNLTFLKKNNRVGVLKLRGAVSYGLILDNYLNFKEGEEVSAILGITKYEQKDVYEASPMSGIRQTSKKKLNPNFFKYCDIENAKNYPDLFTTEDEIVVTEKVHGANARYGWLKRKQSNWFDMIWAKIFGEYEFVYGSRNVQISSNLNYKGFYGEDVYGKAAKKLNLQTCLKQYPDYEFFGEVYGPKIQDLHYGAKEVGVIFFDIKDTNTGKYLDYDEFTEVMRKLFLPSVPVFYRGKFNKDLMLQYAVGTSAIAHGNNLNQIREGVVVKTTKEKTSVIGRTLAKFINPEYLIRENATELK